MSVVTRRERKQKENLFSVNSSLSVFRNNHSLFPLFFFFIIQISLSLSLFAVTPFGPSFIQSSAAAAAAGHASHSIPSFSSES